VCDLHCCLHSCLRGLQGRASAALSALLRCREVGQGERCGEHCAGAVPSSAFAARPQAFVDEFSCIGCRNCNNVCPQTFGMEDDYGCASPQRRWFAVTWNKWSKHGANRSRRRWGQTHDWVVSKNRELATYYALERPCIGLV